MSILILKIFFAGIGLLIGAIILNSIAKFLSLPTWYDFLSQPSITPISFIWLFIVYPFFLGGIVYLLSRLFYS